MKGKIDNHIKKVNEIKLIQNKLIRSLKSFTKKVNDLSSQLNTIYKYWFCKTKSYLKLLNKKETISEVESSKNNH